MAAAVDTGRTPDSPSANPSITGAAGAPLATKMNPVAQEIAVIASGARPSQKTGERELFTEETTTALVFENGGVLRLVAAVVPGQLLFLTNKATNREVVAQVTRKRDFTAMSCYVEVEFTEPSPAFWGIEFPKVPEAAPANSRQAEVVKQVQSAKVIADKPATPTPAPSATEVNALKQELEALRKQLQVLQTQKAATPAVVSSAGVTPIPALPTAAATPATSAPTTAFAANSGSATPASRSTAAAVPDDLARNSEHVPVSVPASASHEPPPVSSEVPQEHGADVAPPVLAHAAAAAATAHSPIVRGPLPIDEDVPAPSAEPSRKLATEIRKPRHAAKPVLAIEPPKRGARSSSNGSRLVLLAAAVLFTVAGTAWYLGMIPGMPPLRNFSANVVPAPNIAQPVSAANAAPAKPSSASVVSKAAAPASTAAGNAVSPATSNAPVPQPASKASAPPAAAPESKASVARDSEVTAKDSETSGNAQRASLLAAPERRSAESSLTKAAKVSAVPSTRDAPVVQPKLIKSVPAMASPDMLQDFASGNSENVTVDAVVDPTGRVTSMKPLSGPASLHSAAMDALKQYKYEPATSHGKPVAAHVTVTIKFVFVP